MIWVLWGHCVLTSVCSPSRILRIFSAPVTRTTGRPRRWVLKTFPYLSRRELWKREPWGRAAGQPGVPASPFPSRPRPPAPYLEQPVEGLPEEGPAHGTLGQGQGAGAVPAEAPAQRPEVPAQGDQQRQGQQRQRRRLGPREPRRHPPAGRRETGRRRVPAPGARAARGGGPGGCQTRGAGRPATPLPAAGAPRLALPAAARPAPLASCCRFAPRPHLYRYWPLMPDPPSEMTYPLHI